MRPRVQPLMACLVLTGSAVLMAGCASANADSPNTLILYNGQHQQTADALVSAFEGKTGINVQVRSDDENVLANQIVQEGANSPADLIYTENSPALAFLESRGLLA